MSDGTEPRTYTLAQAAAIWWETKAKYSARTRYDFVADPITDQRTPLVTEVKSPVDWDNLAVELGYNVDAMEAHIDEQGWDDQHITFEEDDDDDKG